jgi:hypothetical protein
MQDSGALGLRVEKTGEMEGVVLAFRGKVDPALEQDIVYVRQALGLALDAQEFRVAYGSIAKDDKEIAILSRSILEILVDLGSTSRCRRSTSSRSAWRRRCRRRRRPRAAKSRR